MAISSLFVRSTGADAPACPDMRFFQARFHRCDGAAECRTPQVVRARAREIQVQAYNRDRGE